MFVYLLELVARTCLGREGSGERGKIPDTGNTQPEHGNGCPVLCRIRALKQRTTPGRRLAYPYGGSRATHRCALMCLVNNSPSRVTATVMVWLSPGDLHSATFGGWFCWKVVKVSTVKITQLNHGNRFSQRICESDTKRK